MIWVRKSRLYNYDLNYENTWSVKLIYFTNKISLVWNQNFQCLTKSALLEHWSTIWKVAGFQKECSFVFNGRSRTDIMATWLVSRAVSTTNQSGFQNSNSQSRRFSHSNSQSDSDTGSQSHTQLLSSLMGPV